MKTERTYWGDGTLPRPYVPLEITDVEIAFPAGALSFMPPWDDIKDKVDRQWWQFASDWFMNVGVTEVELLPSLFMVDHDFTPEFAWRNLNAIFGSFSSKHQHKIDSAAFLLGLWFRHAQWKVEGDDTLREAGTKELPDDQNEAAP